MKKYFLFAISFFSLVVFFSLQQVPTANAWAREGERCSIAPLAVEEIRCDAAIHFCNLSEGGFLIGLDNEGLCRPKTILDCQCADAGNILCGRPGEPKNIPTTCERPADVCRPAAAEFIGPEDRVNRIELPGTPDGGTERFRGVSCEDAVFPECTCLGGNTAASGQNGVQCKVNGVVVGEGYCSNNQACRPGGTSHQRDFSQLTDNRGNDGRSIPTESNILSGKDLRGATCGAEQVQCECSGTPGLAESGANAIRCKNAGGAVIGEGYCKDNNACNPSGSTNENDIHRLVDNQLNNNAPLPNEERDMNDKDLTGVSCEGLAGGGTRERAPLPPPPPPPPCKTLVAGICTEFNTAVGVLGTAPEAFITRLFAVLLSVSGGIALLLIMKAGYQMMTSQGKPEQLQGGRDQLVAAIVGLVFLIFSFVILQVIGFDLLRIPGFGGAGGGGGPGAGGIGTAPRGALCTNNNECVSGVCGSAPAGPGGNSGLCQ